MWEYHVNQHAVAQIAVRRVLRAKRMIVVEPADILQAKPCEQEGEHRQASFRGVHSASSRVVDCIYAAW
jgi:hypothetical protein